MGELQVTSTQNAEQMRFFMKCLLKDMEALEHMLRTGMIESDRLRIGAEQEMFIVDNAYRPAPLAQEMLEILDDPHFTPELALFNLEYNLDPFDFSGDCFAKLEEQANDLLALAREKLVSSTPT